MGEFNIFKFCAELRLFFCQEASVLGFGVLMLPGRSVGENLWVQSERES